MPDIVIPYEGGNQVVLTEQAQATQKAAMDWAMANPHFANAMQGKSKNQLDQESAQALRELEQQMRATPPKPATVVNLHPWPLNFGATNRFLRGINIPACEPGMPYAYAHIRGYRRDWEYNENGTLKFKPILPIQLAAEFVREFSNKDTYGGGVIIFPGDANPEKMLDKDVETYDPIGRLITKDEPTIEYDDENHAHPAMMAVPVRRKLAELIAEQRTQRNRVYLNRVRKADQDYKLPNGKGAWLITPVHQLMAEMLFAEHEIPAVPDWNLSSRLEQGLAENSCPACGGDPRQGSFKCSSCGHILNAFKAYEAGAIEYGHVSMETMTSDEWEQVEEIREAREKNRREAAERRKAKPAAEAKPATKAKAKAEKDEPIRPKKDKEEDSDE